MAIDASIALGVKPVQFDDPFSAQNVQNRISFENQRSLARERDAQTEINRAKLEREQQVNASADRDLAEQRTQDEIIAKNSAPGPDGAPQTNHQAVVQQLIANGLGHRVPAYQKNVMIPEQKEAIQKQKDQLDIHQKSVEQLGAALGSLAAVDDANLPAEYDKQVKNLEASKVAPPGQIPTYGQLLQQAAGDPTKALALVKQQLAQGQQGALAAGAQLTQAREALNAADNHNKALQDLTDNKVKGTEKQLAVGGQILGNAATPQDWEQGKRDLAAGGVPMNIIAQFGDFGPEAAQRAQQLSMTVEQRQQAADKAAELNKKIPGRDIPLPADVQAQKLAEKVAGRDPTAANLTALDRETKQFGAPHSKSLESATGQLEKIADARAMINGNAEAQALGVPKVLTALVGGQGTGVRITTPELNAIAKARGIVGDVEGTLSSLAGKGKLTSTQQQQLTGMLDDVKARIEQKRAIAADALDRINGAKTRDEIVAVDKEARSKLQNLETSTAAPKSGRKVGDPVTIKGKQMKITAVYPDGTFDAQ